MSGHTQQANDRGLNRLLTLCACGAGHPTQTEHLRQQSRYINAIDAWADLPKHAELHGLGPLTYYHLQRVEGPLPSTVRRSLQGLFLRHRRANAIRAQALSDILVAFEVAGIPVLVLKGAALAHLVYPQPGLRPMRDIDLLVKPDDVAHARRLLGQLGFTLPPTPMHGIPADHHHLAAIKRVIDGLSVSIELHHALELHETDRPARTFDEFAPTALAFDLNGRAARTLSREAMLWHVYRHGFCVPLLYEPLRLIWLADLVSLVETWVHKIDWGLVRHRYPALWRVLPLFHALLPWSETVLDKLNAKVRPFTARCPTYEGWPCYPIIGAQEKSAGRTLYDTFLPSAWWLSVYYGEGGSLPGLWRAWLNHLRHLWPDLRRTTALHYCHQRRRLHHLPHRLLRKWT